MRRGKSTQLKHRAPTIVMMPPKWVMSRKARFSQPRQHMQKTTRDDLRSRLEDNDRFTLIEVLEPTAYESHHLPRAVNIPLDDEFEAKVERVVTDKGEPIIVYCESARSGDSNAAAHRLEAMGYRQVFDYEGGKADWRRAGLALVRS